jgi:hypothetical protein
MLPHDANETVIQTVVSFVYSFVWLCRHAKLSSCQLHLTHFAELVSTATSTPSNSSGTLRSTNDGPKASSHDAAWTHAGRGVRLAQRMGLHISPSSWPGMSEDEKTRRDDLWWGLFVADTWTVCIRKICMPCTQTQTLRLRALTLDDRPPSRAHTWTVLCLSIGPFRPMLIW